MWPQKSYVVPLSCPLQPPFSTLFPSFLSLTALAFYFLFIWISLLWVLHISGVVQCLSCCNWFISLSIMSSVFIHVGAHVRASLLCTAVGYSTVYINHILLLHSSAEGTWGCFAMCQVPGLRFWDSLFLITYFSGISRVISCFILIEKNTHFYY